MSNLRTFALEQGLRVLLILIQIYACRFHSATNGIIHRPPMLSIRELNPFNALVEGLENHGRPDLAVLELPVTFTTEGRRGC
jgi:hypothetical protein